ncbi:MAG: lipopolysaccharide heptosyltransferase II [bacterium]
MRGSRLFRLLDKILGVSLIFILGVWDRARRSIKRGQRNEEIGRILVIKLSAVGDTVLLSPILHDLRDHYHRAHIAMLATPINYDVVAHCPHVDEVIKFELGRRLLNPLDMLRFILSLRERKFDLAIDFEQWVRITPLLAYWAGIRRRVGFKTRGQGRHFLYTLSVAHGDDKHEVECYRDILRALGVEITHSKLELYETLADERKAIKFLRENGVEAGDFLVGIHPGCGNHGHPREWVPERYGQVADFLMASGAKVVLTGGSAERALVERVAKSMKHQPIIEAGELNLRELMEVTKRCKVFISGNTGLMHIASAALTPLVALHGPTDPKRWGPWQGRFEIVRSKKECAPCLNLGFEYGCRYPECMETITVDDVMGALESIVSEGSGVRGRIDREEEG